MQLLNETKTLNKNRSDFSYRFSWFQLIRPLTLTGTISPILAGTALAVDRGPLRVDHFIFVLTAALLVQGASNIFNDYFDFKNGQDQEKWVAKGDPAYGRGPHWHSLPYAAFLMIMAAAIIGAWLSLQTSGWIAVIGALGILSGYAYSAGRRSLSSLGLGELTAAVFLGFVPSILAYAVQGHSPDGRIIAVSVPFALLISSMILSNNIRDIKKDYTFRRTLAMMLGRVRAARLLAVLLFCSYAWVLVLIAFRILPWTAAAVFLAFPLALRLRWSYRPGAARGDEISGMKWAARHHWVFGLCFALGLWL